MRYYCSSLTSRNFLWSTISEISRNFPKIGPFRQAHLISSEADLLNRFCARRESRESVVFFFTEEPFFFCLEFFYDFVEMINFFFKKEMK